MSTFFEHLNLVITLHVDAVSFIFLSAFIGVAAWIPRVHGQVDILGGQRFYSDTMSGASLTAEIPLAWAFCLVIEHEEVVVEPPVCVKADHSGLSLLIVFFNRHEKDTIVRWHPRRTRFFPSLRSPKFARITVATLVCFGAPRITHLDELGSS